MGVAYIECFNKGQLSNAFYSVNDGRTSQYRPSTTF